MTANPPRAPRARAAPTDDEPAGVGIAYYRTDHEMAGYLRALRHVPGRRLVVVLGLREGGRLPLADLPADVRLIPTAEEPPTDPDRVVGWFLPDALRAVALGMAGRQPGDGLILLFPDDWRGPAPEELLERARRGRGGVW